MKKQKIVLSQLRNETLPFDSAALFSERSNCQTIDPSVLGGIYVGTAIAVWFLT